MGWLNLGSFYRNTARGLSLSGPESCSPCQPSRGGGGGTSHPEALSFAVDVAQTQVDVGADALHGLQRQGAPQVLGIGPGGGQAESKPA